MPLTATHVRVLGIDSSLTATGLCRIDIDVYPGDKIGEVSRTWETPQVFTVTCPGPKTKTRREYSRRISYALDTIDAAMEDVDRIMMEELAYGAKGDTAFVLPWVWGRIIDCAEARDIPIAFANQSQLKKYATGRGNAVKEEVVLAVAKQWPEVAIKDNNQADALTLALMCARGLDHPIDHPTVARAEVMAKIGAATI